MFWSPLTDQSAEEHKQSLARQGFIECPHCGSTRVKTTSLRGLQDFILLLTGAYRFRCSHCASRFYHRPLGPLNAAWAKCPKCLRMDLSSWDVRLYRPTRWMRLQLWFGGNPWRCERCRQNFVSFRPRKERYVRNTLGEESA